MEPTITVAALGLIGGVCSYLAGRNRWLSKALRETTAAYTALITELREEIDRLKAEVSELRNLLAVRSRPRKAQ